MGQGQCRQIAQHVTCEHVPGQYWALAQFAGHQGPDTTVKSYLHLCDLISARCLQRAQFDWTHVQRRYFTGLSDRELRAKGLDQGPLNYERCLPHLQEKLHRRLHLQTISSVDIAPLPPPTKRKTMSQLVVGRL